MDSRGLRYRELASSFVQSSDCSVSIVARPAYTGLGACYFLPRGVAKAFRRYLPRRTLAIPADQDCQSVGKAIDEEAAKCRDEDWSLMVGYVQACLEKLPGELEEWQKD